MAVTGNSTGAQATPTDLPQGAPDLGVLSQPGSAAPVVSPQAPPVGTSTAVPSGSVPAPAAPVIPPTVNPLVQKLNDETAKLEQIGAQSTAPPPPGPHARLLSMVQGLALGLDSFGKAIATHGKEGGAEEVAQVQAQQQQQKIQAQQARDAAKDQQLQQQLKVIDTVMATGNMAHLAATWPQEMTREGLLTTKAEVDTKDAAFQSGLTTGDFSDYYKAKAQAQIAAGTDPSKVSTYTPATPGTIAAREQIPPQAMMRWQGNVQIAAETFKDDPTIQRAKAVIENPNSTAEEMASASQMASARMNALGAGVKIKQEQADLDKTIQANDPLYKYESDPKALAEPGAQATLDAFIKDPKNKDNVDGIARATVLMGQAKVAQDRALQIDNIKAQQTENARVAATAGDPKVAGQMLVDGGLTLADLRSRGSSPQQIEQATQAAINYAKSKGIVYNASDETNGEKDLAQPANQTFYGSARSLVQPGGMLDNLQRAHDALGNTKLPAFNTIADWEHFQAGDPAMAIFKQQVLAAADDYAKVMGGGNPTIEQFKALRDGFAANLNNMGFDGAINVARSSVRSQVSGKIGGNRYINQREGDILQDKIAAPAESPASKIHASLSDFTHHYASSKGEIFSDDGKTWYDLTGNTVGGK